jgi:hypothetical protein
MQKNLELSLLLISTKEQIVAIVEVGKQTKKEVVAWWKLISIFIN